MKDQIKELAVFAKKLILENPELNIVSSTTECPWFIKELQNQLSILKNRNELLLPNLKDENESIAIFSDYGGESSTSKYHTYSFLICAWNQPGTFTQEMEKLRKENDLNLKEIAFKNFNHGPTKRSLEKYLIYLNNYVNGLLFTVSVEKSVGSLFSIGSSKISKSLLETLNDSGYGEWKPDVAEKLLRIIHFSSYLVALLSKKDQKIFWMTDNDAIASSDKHFMHTLNLFSNTVRKYCTHNLGKIGGLTPFKDKNAMTLDLLSATDITAGSIEHYLTREKEMIGELTIKEEADKVLMWLANQGLALKKHSMSIQKIDGKVGSGTLKFMLKNKNIEGKIITI